MNSSKNLIKVGEVEVLVLHKKIKNLHLNVLPPDGKVRVSAPIGMSDDAIRTFVVGRLGWIKNKKANFKGQERQTIRKYISGESHYFLGKRYRLEVLNSEKHPRAYLKGKSKLVIEVNANSTAERREKLLYRFYREQLNKILSSLVSKWSKKMALEAPFWGVRRMKTKWGSCNEKSRRIWFNLELIKKPENCIEYVVVHELVHLIERTHNDKFVSLIEKFLPKWKEEKEELNRLILAYEKWR